MMASLKYIVILGFAMHLIGAVPVTRLRNKARPYKRTDRVCVQAATALGEVLTGSGDIIIPASPSVSLSQLGLDFTGWDLLDQGVREQLLCQLEGITSLSELESVLDSEGITRQLVRVALSYASHLLPWIKRSIERMISYDSKYCPKYQAQLDLIADIEAAGWTDLDLDTPAIDALVANSRSFFVHGDPELPEQAPLSTAPIPEQCLDMYKDPKEVWKYAVRDILQWNPNAAEDMRAAVYNWTGIEMSVHGRVHEKICALMEVVAEQGADGFYERLKAEGVLTRLLKRAYAEVPRAVRELRNQIAWATGDHSSFYNGLGDQNGGYGNYYHYRNKRRQRSARQRRQPDPNGPYINSYSNYPDNGIPDYPNFEYYSSRPDQNDVVTFYADLGILLSVFEEMGLYTLVDDLP